MEKVKWKMEKDWPQKGARIKKIEGEPTFNPFAPLCG
jgi:hypothetical protein